MTMTTGGQASGEQPALQILSIESNAETWFQIDPQNAKEDLHNQALRIGALLELPPDHPEVQDINDRLYHGTDLTMAHVIVRTTLKQAYDHHKLAVDELTGLKTQYDYNRWVVSAFGGEKRKPKPRSYASYKGDVNNFKRINDELGEKVGDEVLRAAAREIVESLRVGDHIIAVRPHSAGDEILIAAADLNENDAKGLWRRLYTTQWEKVGSQAMIWQGIQHALARRPPEQKEVTVTTEVTHLEDMVLVRRMLVVNGEQICDIKDLAIIDIGYSTGMASSIEEVQAINELANLEKDRVKRATRETIQAYRPSN